MVQLEADQSVISLQFVVYLLFTSLVSQKEHSTDIVNHNVVGAAHEDQATNCNNYLNKYVKTCAYADNGINGAISHLIGYNLIFAQDW